MTGPVSRFRLRSPVDALRPVLMALATALGASVADAQRPDFSGEWIRVVDSTAGRPSVAATGDAAFRRGDMGSGWGSPLIIRQTPDSLIVEYQHFGTYDLQPRLHFVYRLDGAESRNTIMIGHADSEQRSRASWSGDTLVVSTTFPAPTGGRTTTLRQALSVATDGTLTLEVSRESSPAVRATYRKR